MHTDVVPDRQAAHELVERLRPEQLTTVVSLLQFMLSDSVSRALASAPIDDEAETEDERDAVRDADDWFAQREVGISHDEVKRQFGLE